MTKRTGWLLLGLSMALLVAALLLRRAGILGTNHLFGISVVATLLAFAGRAVLKAATAREQR